jgi:hypothetical protein
LVVADRKLVVLLSKFDGDGDSARRAAEASAEAMKVRFAEVDVDDGLDIPASLRRTAP